MKKKFEILFDDQKNKINMFTKYKFKINYL